MPEKPEINPEKCEHQRQLEDFIPCGQVPSLGTKPADLLSVRNKQSKMQLCRLAKIYAPLQLLSVRLYLQYSWRKNHKSIKVLLTQVDRPRPPQMRPQPEPTCLADEGEVGEAWSVSASSTLIALGGWRVVVVRWLLPWWTEARGK